MTRSITWTPSGAPYCAPTERPWRFGQPAAAAAAASYYPATLYTGGYNGFLFDGLESTILQASGGAAAGNGDVVGYISDESGLAQSLAQGTGANKPTLAITNSIPAIKFGAAKFLEGTLGTAYQGNPETWVGILYNPNPNVQWYPFVFDAAGGAAELDYLNVQGTSLEWRINNLVVGGGPVFTSLEGTAFIYRCVATGAGTWTTDKYTLAGAEVSTATGSLTARNHGTALKYGYSSNTSDGETAFQMHINRAITGADWTALLADLVSRFGAWR